MFADEVIADRCESRTFDDSRYDSNELERDLKFTAVQCNIVAEKLLKKGSIKKHQKTECIDYGQERISELERVIATLKIENTKLNQLLKNKNGLSNVKENETTESKSNYMPKCQNCTEKISSLLAENVKIRQLLKDVTEVNKRWQKYNQERQEYLQHLLESIHELQQKQMTTSSELLGNDMPPVGRKWSKLVVGCRHSDSQLEKMGEQSALHQRYENAVKEICQLQKQLEDARQIQEATVKQLELTRTENNDKLFMLEMQTKIFKEDWEAEKQERLIAQEKVSQLTEELNDMKKKIDDQKKRLKTIQETSCNPNAPIKTFWQRLNPTAPFHSTSSIMNEFQPTYNFVERGTRNIGRQECLIADGTTDTKRSASAPNSLSTLSEQLLSENDYPLECPGCKKTFPKNLHLKFLDHFEECQVSSSPS